MQDKIRIGLIAYDLSTLAGGTNLALTLGSELQKEGYNIAYASVYEDLSNLSKKFNISPDYRIFKAKNPILGRKMLTYNSLFNHSFPVYKMCREFKPDIVIETGGFLLSLIIPMFFKIPAIYYCMEPQREYSQGIHRSLKNRLYFFPYKIIENLILNERVKVCAISDYTRKRIQKYSNTRITVIYPPVNTNIFLPSDKKENIILCVLRFMPDHKFERLIAAFKRLNRADYSLVIIGGLTNEHQKYYNSLIELIKDDKNVILKPNADFKELLCYYEKSRIFWYPIGAFYGIVVAEAQSSGLPTISCGGDSGPGEIIINGRTGYLVKTFDEMIENTNVLINDDKLWKDMSVAARDNAVSRLGTDVFRARFREVIENIRR